MKIQKQVSRIVNGKKYLKYWVVIPPSAIKELGFKDRELDYEIKDKNVMRITYLDGKRYSRAVLAASLWINEKQQRLNDINVYPVPDGDTGTNMASTMVSIAESIRANNFSDTIEIAGDQVAESALNGARGNSGAILAQFFYGLSEGFKGQIKVSTKHFADAVHRAVESSYEALSHPKEGTTHP